MGKLGVLTEGCTRDTGPQPKGHTLKEGADDEGPVSVT
jgi:hypothetical protein